MADLPNPILWFQSIPLLTRVWFGATLGITGGITMDMIPRTQIMFHWDKIWYPQLELWRLATSFCFAGNHLREFPTLLLLYLIYIVVRQYEDRPLNVGAGGTKADAAFALLFCWGSILCSYPIMVLYLPRSWQIVPHFTRNLAFAVMYLWSRKNPHVQADINFIPVKGAYVPFAHLGIALCMGHRINEMVHGMVVGHVFYYLAVVVPTIRGGRRILSTPTLLVELFNENYNYNRDIRIEEQDVVPPQQPPEQQGNNNNVF